MQPADRAAVIGLLAESDPWKRLGYTVDSWDRMFAPMPQGRESLVLTQADHIAGIAILRSKFLLGDYLELLAIAPALTGQGLGAVLLHHLESLVFARANNFFACVSDFNTGARRFYRRHGFQEVGPLPDLLVPGSAEILLRKTIGPVKDGNVPRPSLEERSRSR